MPQLNVFWSFVYRCRGAITKCIKSSLGCTFQGPRSALQSHLWECHYRDQQSGNVNIISFSFFFFFLTTTRGKKQDIMYNISGVSFVKLAQSQNKAKHDNLTKLTPEKLYIMSCFLPLVVVL